MFFVYVYASAYAYVYVYTYTHAFAFAYVFLFLFRFRFWFRFFILICRCREFFCRKEAVRFPVDLSGRGTEQRFCVFYPYFPSSVRRGAARRPTVLFTESTVILRSRAVGRFFMIIFRRLFLDFSG